MLHHIALKLVGLTLKWLSIFTLNFEVPVVPNLQSIAFIVNQTVAEPNLSLAWLCYHLSPSQMIWARSKLWNETESWQTSIFKVKDA